MRTPLFCKTKHPVILLTSLLLSSLLLAVYGENSSSIVDFHGPIAGTVQIAQAAAGTISEFSIPTVKALPAGIGSGPDGNLWFSEEDGDQIGRITPKGTIDEFSPPNPGQDRGITDITLGPDGNLWFSEEDASKIGRITPKGTISEFPIPTANSWPQFIALGPDGNLLFTEYNGNKIGRITPKGTIISEFPIPTVDTDPLGITL